LFRSGRGKKEEGKTRRGKRGGKKGKRGGEGGEKELVVVVGWCESGNSRRGFFRRGEKESPFFKKRYAVAGMELPPLLLRLSDPQRRFAQAVKIRAKGRVREKDPCQEGKKKMDSAAPHPPPSFLCHPKEEGIDAKERSSSPTESLPHISFQPRAG